MNADVERRERTYRLHLLRAFGSDKSGGVDMESRDEDILEHLLEEAEGHGEEEEVDPQRDAAAGTTKTRPPLPAKGANARTAETMTIPSNTKLFIVSLLKAERVGVVCLPDEAATD
jgi:hypothetical protein